MAVDGVVVAKLRRGEQMTTEVEAGRHDVDIRIDWKHYPVSIDVAEGETIAITCSPRSALAVFDMLPGGTWVDVEVRPLA